MKIAFASIYACKNIQRIWRNNASTSRSRDVTDQMWWRHNAKTEKIFLGDKDEMNDRGLFFGGVVCSEHIK